MKIKYKGNEGGFMWKPMELMEKFVVFHIMRNFCLRKNLKSPETMEVRR